MAGKHSAVPDAADSTTAAVRAKIDPKPPVFPGGKLDKVYMEGREHVATGGTPLTGNPHPAGSEAKAVWDSAGLLYFNSATNTADLGLQTFIPDKS